MTREEMKKLLLNRAVDIYDGYFVGGNDKSITIEKYDSDSKEGYKTIIEFKNPEVSVEKILDYDIDGKGNTVEKFLSDKNYNDYSIMQFDGDESFDRWCKMQENK